MQKAKHDKGSFYHPLGVRTEKQILPPKGISTYKHNIDDSIDSKMQKAKQLHEKGSSYHPLGVRAKKQIHPPKGIPTYKHNTEDNIDLKMQKVKQSHEKGSYQPLGVKAKKQIHPPKGIPTYKHNKDDNIDIKMQKVKKQRNEDFNKGKTGNRSRPLQCISQNRNITDDKTGSDIAGQTSPRLHLKFTEYLAALRAEIERSDTSQLLSRFEEVKDIYHAYKRFEAVPLRCEICDVKATEVEPLFQHYNCSKHKKNINSPEIKKHVNFDEHFRRMDLMSKIIDMRRKGIFECELCSLTFNKRERYAAHKKSKYHETYLYKSYCAVIIANAVKRTTNGAFRL